MSGPVRTGTGSGVLLVESFWTKDGYKLAFIVAYDHFAQKYQDFGGKKETNYSIKQTAIKEANEESCGYLVLKDNDLKDFVDIKFKNEFYRMYIILLANKQFFASKYYSNKNKLLCSNISNDYKETSKITRIFLEDLPLTLLQTRGDIECIDCKNNKIILDSRVKVAIRLINEQNIINNCTEKYVEEYKHNLFGHRDKNVHSIRTKN